MEFNARTLSAGVAGGLAGGVIFGVMMTAMDMMGMVAALVGSSSIAVGWAVHLVISAALGAGFAVLLGARASGTGPAASLGAAWGLAAWVGGALLVMPLLLGMPPFEIGQTQLLSLMGHVLFGVIAGVVYHRLSRVEEQVLGRA
jgi:hypothetical protein